MRQRFHEDAASALDDPELPLTSEPEVTFRVESVARAGMFLHCSHGTPEEGASARLISDREADVACWKIEPREDGTYVLQRVPMERFLHAIDYGLAGTECVELRSNQVASSAHWRLRRIEGTQDCFAVESVQMGGKYLHVMRGGQDEGVEVVLCSESATMASQWRIPSLVVKELQPRGSPAKEASQERSVLDTPTSPLPCFPMHADATAGAAASVLQRRRSSGFRSAMQEQSPAHTVGDLAKVYGRRSRGWALADRPFGKRRPITRQQKGWPDLLGGGSPSFTFFGSAEQKPASNQCLGWQQS